VGEAWFLRHTSRPFDRGLAGRERWCPRPAYHNTEPSILSRMPSRGFL
jgi:hypothetical protein